MSGIEEALKAASDTRALRIGSGILGEVPGLFREQFPGQKAVVVADQTTYRVAGEQVHQALKAANLELADPVIFSHEIHRIGMERPDMAGIPVKIIGADQKIGRVGRLQDKHPAGFEHGKGLVQ